LETYLLRYRDAAARTDANASLPDVRVVATAAASTQPASPKVTLTLAAVAVVSLMLQVGQILFAELVSGRALIETTREGHVYDSDEPHMESPRKDDVVAKQPAENVMQKDMLSLLRKGDVSDVGEVRDEMAIAGELIAINDEKAVLVVSLNGADSSAAVEALSAELIGRGRSVVEIDAGSHQSTAESGLSDLCEGNADFGDVVHRGQRSDFAVVPWGQKDKINFNTERCGTLIDALRDVFETVVINAGGAGIGSSLPVFSGLDALILLAVPPQTPIAETERIRRDVETVGFKKFHVVRLRGSEHMVA
jgi:hypothetical protein